jgi:ABC-type lipoprotein export system ATPase subunit
VVPRSAARESRPAEARGILGQPIGIRVDGVARVFKTGEVETAALQEVTFDIAPGEFVAVTGPSGCGKTTLLNLLGGLDRPSSGRTLVAGVPLDQLPGGGLDDYRLLRVGSIFQFFNLVPTMTAEDNVALPMTLAGVPERDRRRRARWLLGLVGLDHRAGFLPARLAGGEQQRVAIARALANQPGLLLADEPTGNLDSATGEQVLQLLRDLNRRGATIVLVTHDPEVARRADRAVRLRDGRIFSDSGSSRMTARAPLQAQTPTRLGAGDAFRLGLRDVGRRKLRTALTAGGATLGIALAALILSLKAGSASPVPYSFLALVALIVASFGIVNTMYTSLANRTKEIGTFKALGARSRDVLILFLAEATIVGVTAAVLGPALAFGLALVGNFAAAADTFTISPAVLLVSVGLALLVSLLSGTLPALRGARTDPARALRGE